MIAEENIRDISTVYKEQKKPPRYRSPTSPRVIKPNALRPSKVTYIVKSGVAQRFDFYVILSVVLIVII